MFSSDIHKLVEHAPTHVRELPMFKEHISHMMAQTATHKKNKKTNSL